MTSYSCINQRDMSIYVCLPILGKIPAYFLYKVKEKNVYNDKTTNQETYPDQ